MAGNSRPSLVVLGAAGFVGRALLSLGHLQMPVKAVARRASTDAESARPGVTWFDADLAKPAALDHILAPNDIVCNLAYHSDVGLERNLALMENIVNSSVRSGVFRIVHCSTAVVVGNSTASRVNESTACRPRTEYERTKFLLEQRVAQAVARGVDVGIVRPTAVIGVGGQNLLKLANSLRFGNPIVNYLRASLFNRRAMHLVPVRDVAAALLHVALIPGQLAGETFNVSADDEVGNDFRNIEATLLDSMGMQPRRIALLPFPGWLLSVLLRAFGRSDWSVSRTYDSCKLARSGFSRAVSVTEAVREFGNQFKLRAIARDRAAGSSCIED